MKKKNKKTRRQRKIYCVLKKHGRLALPACCYTTRKKAQAAQVEFSQKHPHSTWEFTLATTKLA